MLCYTLEGLWPLTFALMLGIFASSAYLPILNGYTAELFPTRLRGMAFAWSNNLLGRLGYVLSPVAVGFIVRETDAFGPDRFDRDLQPRRHRAGLRHPARDEGTRARRHRERLIPRPRNRSGTALGKTDVSL
ncbi:MAG: hypothetical protein R3B99_26800 [Polyangiales bacterium]